MKERSPSQEIDAMIKESGDWRGRTLANLRNVIKEADPLVLEEVKWKKPSNPQGVPVWSHDGMVCIGNTLKNAVRLTFPKGAELKDPMKLFNTRLDSETVRAKDVHERDSVHETALKALILAAVALNTSNLRARKGMPPGVADPFVTRGRSSERCLRPVHIRRRVPRAGCSSREARGF